MDETFLKIYDLARSYLDTRENEEHTRLACEFATRLLHEEGGDPNVVLPATILHDVGWKRIPEDLQLTAFGPGRRDKALNRVHEEEGARITADILATVMYPAHLAEEIVAIVSGHDSMPKALSLNDAIVKDSDKLWRYTEHGVCLGIQRFAMTRPQYLKRLRTKLRVWFLTGAAKRIAKAELQLRDRATESQD